MRLGIIALKSRQSICLCGRVDDIEGCYAKLRHMDVKEIENAIASLPPTEIAELARWFAYSMRKFGISRSNEI